MGKAFLYECKLCEASMKHYPKFVEHLLNEHDLGAEDAYVKFVLNGNQPYCECGCGEKAGWSWRTGYSKYIRGHNAREDSIFCDKEFIKRSVEKRISGYREGKYKPWNAGLTSNVDGRVKKSSEKASETLRNKYENGEIVSWQLGLTKETDCRIAAMSQTKKEKIKSGEIQMWNMGLTKETSPSILSASKKISSAYQKRLMGKRLSMDIVRERIEESGFDLIHVEDDDGYKTRKSKTLRIRCRTCGSINIKSLYSIEGSPRCNSCNPHDSAQQIKIYEFISSLGIQASMGDRDKAKPYEIDILCENNRIGFEYDGLYWHSEKFRNEFYHEKKRIAATESSIKLYRIFEDEWQFKRSVVESFIRHKLGVNSRKIYARKCNIVELDNKERKDFFNSSHLDGDVKCKKAYGLMFEGKIIAAISIRKSFHRKWDQYYEVARFAIANDYSCPGGFSRLSKYALGFAKSENKLGLISYVDTRHGTGDSYLKTGWNFISKTDPRFWWTDFENRFDRFNFRANKTMGLTQKEVAKKNNVLKIWGCANLVFTLQ